MRVFDIKNCIMLKSCSLFTYKFAYFDIKENYLADDLFIKYKIRVKFGREFWKDDDKYALIMCKIKKRDVPKFIQAIEELENKALLIGYVDYPDFCKKTIESFNHREK